VGEADAADAAEIVGTAETVVIAGTAGKSLPKLAVIRRGCN